MLTAEQSISGFDRGGRLLGLTGGQFSFLDLIRALLGKTGPAHVLVSAWTAGLNDIENAAYLLESGDFLSFRLLADSGFPAVAGEYFHRFVELFGDDSVTLTNNHAKFALITNDDWGLCIRTSMNLNKNPRFEYFEVEDDAELVEFFRSFADSIKGVAPAATAPREQQGKAFRKALELLDETMSAAEYAAHRGITVRAVHKAIEQGRCPRTEAGIPVRLADQQWPISGASTPTRISTNVPDEDLTLHEIKMREGLAKARLAEMKVERERGDLVAIEDVARVYYGILRKLRNRLRAIPGRTSALVVAEEDVGDVRRMLSGEIDDALRMVDLDDEEGGGDG